MSNDEIFLNLKNQSAIADDGRIMELFDSLPPVSCDDILSRWRGGGFDTGHWLLRTLGDMKWYGKWFVSARDVKPLVCQDDRGQLYSNNALDGEASLWMIEFRGKSSATVVYDGVPMFGHLRRVNDDTLLGVVSGKTVADGVEIVQDGKYQYFYLERIGEWPAPFVDG